MRVHWNWERGERGQDETRLTDEETDVGKGGADAGCGGDEEVYAFAVCEAGDDDDGDLFTNVRIIYRHKL